MVPVEVTKRAASRTGVANVVDIFLFFIHIVAFSVSFAIFIKVEILNFHLRRNLLNSSG